MDATRGPVEAGCKVCGRRLRNRPGERGRPPVYCPPKLGEARSVCAMLDARFAEVAKLAKAICADVRSGDPDEPESPAVRARLQAVKSYLWKEANSATNRGKLVSASADRVPYKKTRSGWWRARGPRDSTPA